MANLSWTISLQSSDAAISVSRAPQAFDAYDHVNAILEPGDADVQIEIQPGAADRLVLCLVQSSYYGPELTFVASDGAADSKEVVLNEPQLFAGGGVALLEVDPKLLKFTNTSADKTATIDIYVFRDATP